MGGFCLCDGGCHDHWDGLAIGSLIKQREIKMGILTLLLVLALIGGAAVLLVKLLNPTPGVTKVIYIVAVVACVLIALQAFGIRLPNPGVPQIR